MRILPPKPIEIVYSSVPEDRSLRDELEAHLASLERSGRVTQWHEGNLQAGTEWAEVMFNRLNTADIILLLVSPDFIHSDYHYYVILDEALKKHNLGEAIVIPIILRPVLLEGTPLSQLPVLPPGGKPITAWPNHDEAFYYVTSILYKTVNGLLSKRWLDESSIYHTSELYEEALEAYDQAIELNPQNIDAFMGKGAILWHLKHNEEALKVYEQIISLDPTNIVAHLSKSWILLYMGHYEEALEVCNQVIRLDPTIGIVYLIKKHLHELLATQAHKKAKEIRTGKQREFIDDRHFIVTVENF